VQEGRADQSPWSLRPLLGDSGEDFCGDGLDSWAGGSANSSGPLNGVGLWVSASIRFTGRRGLLGIVLYVHLRLRTPATAATSTLSKRSTHDRWPTYRPCIRVHSRLRAPRVTLRAVSCTAVSCRPEVGGYAVIYGAPSTLIIVRRRLPTRRATGRHHGVEDEPSAGARPASCRPKSGLAYSRLLRSHTRGVSADSRDDAVQPLTEGRLEQMSGMHLIFKS